MSMHLIAFVWICIDVQSMPQVPTLQPDITAYMAWELDVRRDLPVVVGVVFAAFAAEPTLRHV